MAIDGCKIAVVDASQSNLQNGLTSPGGLWRWLGHRPWLAVGALLVFVGFLTVAVGAGVAYASILQFPAAEAGKLPGVTRPEVRRQWDAYRAARRAEAAAGGLDPALDAYGLVLTFAEDVSVRALRLADEAPGVYAFEIQSMDFHREGRPMMGHTEEDELRTERCELELSAELERSGWFEALAPLARAGRFQEPFGSRVANARHTGFARARALMRLLGGRLVLAAGEADPARFKLCIELVLAMARAQTEIPGSIAWLNGHGQTGVIYQLVGELARERRLSGAHVQAAIDALDRQVELPPLATALEGDGIIMLDSLDAVGFERAAAAETYLPGFTKVVGRGVAALALPSFAEVEGTTDFYFDRWIAVASARRGQRPALLADALGPLDGPRVASGSLPKLNDVHLQLLATEDLALVGRAATRVTLAIERFRLRTGELPRTLAELVPADIGAIPTDPAADAGSAAPLLLYERRGDRYLLRTPWGFVERDGPKRVRNVTRHPSAAEAGRPIEEMPDPLAR